MMIVGMNSAKEWKSWLEKAYGIGEAIGGALGDGLRDAFQKLQDENDRLRADLAAAVGELDALAKALTNALPLIPHSQRLAHPPLIYDTDDSDEIDESIKRAMRCVPECPRCRLAAALRPAGDQAKGGG